MGLMDILTVDEAVRQATQALPIPLRTQLAHNGGALVDITGWTNSFGTSGAGTTARVADGNRFGQLMTWTTASTAVGGGGGYGRTSVTDIEIPAAGQNFAVAMSVIPSRRQRLRIEVKFYDSSNAQVGATLFGGSVVVLGQARKTLTASVTVPATAVRAGVQAVAVTSSGDGVLWKAGDTLLVSQPIAEAAAAAGPFFTGADQGCAWTGTAHTSTATGRTPTFTSPPVVNGDPLPTAADLAALHGTAETYKGGWATGASYSVNDVVYQSGIEHICLTQHTAAAAFSTDFAAGKWKRHSYTQQDVRQPPRAVSDYAAGRWARIFAPLMAIPPTISWLASGFSLTTQLGSSPIESVFSDASPLFRKVGVVTSSISVASTTVEGNISNGSAARQPFSDEFVYNSPDGKLLVSHVPQGVTTWNPGVLVEVDGRPATWNMVRDPSPVNSSLRAVLITGLPKGRDVLVRLTYQGLDRRSIAVSSGTTISASTSTRKKLFILGDSWIEGGSAANTHPTWPHSIAPLLARLFDADTAFGGQGSTGYTTTPGAPKTAYGNTDRLTQLYAYAPDYILVWGTQNDDANFASVQAAATAMFTAIKTNLPSAQILLVGPVSTTYDLSGNRQSSITALKAAATAATNVLGNAVIDPHNENWISGNGFLGTVDGQGVGDTYMHTDHNHPTLLGGHYYARRAFEALVELFLKQGLISYDGFAL